MPENKIINHNFPLSNKYDANWVMKNNMGPNVLWLTEWLCEEMPLKKGMKILDLGCGKALSSIFLAKEFGVNVFAADLWVDVTDNKKRIDDAGVSNLVVPIKAEAHALPFAENYFDAIVSVDAYMYFGTDVLYLNYLSRFLKKDGLVGVAMPALTKSLPKKMPDYLITPQKNGKVFWEPEMVTLKTKEWWCEHFEALGKIKVKNADIMVKGCNYWADFEDALEQAEMNLFPSDAETLRKDNGDYIGFVRVVAEKIADSDINLYDSALMAKLGL